MATTITPLLIDGSVLEGGGQLLRNSIALAALLSKPVSIHNIRNSRKPPGLKNQHAAGIRLTGDICSARMTGVSNGSRTVDFHPGAIEVGREYTADPGTAGSISLLLQVSLPCLLFQSSPPFLNTDSTLTLRGGTNASNAPQIDYTEHVFLPFLKRHFGFSPRLKIVKRGYYPKGGGLVNLTLPPLPSGTSLPPVSLTDRGALKRIHGKAYVGGSLPILLAQKMSKAASRKLSDALALDSNHIAIESVKEADKNVGGGGSGSGIVLWAETESGCVLGGSALGGKRQDPAGVGEAAAEELIRGIQAGGCVDEYMQDQMIIFLALARGISVVKTGMPLTLHTKTAIWVAEQLTNAKFRVEEDESGSTTICCEGIGYTSQPLLPAQTSVAFE